MSRCLPRSRVLAAALWVCTPAGWLYGAPPPDLDAYLARTMKAFEVPGMALTLVEPGRTPLARGYGVRKLGSAERVDEHTLFPIASNTKAFTATALAMLVDEGKLKWDDKVTDRLPGFRMYDAYTTHGMTILDLLTHRSGLGLGAGDLLFWPSTTFTREEIVHRLRYVKPATSFRSGFAYDNVLYIVAGELIEAVAGMPWESFVQQRIFTPLGMRDSVPDLAAATTSNRACPHARLGGIARGFGTLKPLETAALPDNAAPAGGINASASDMARWIQLHLGRGAIGDKRLLSEQAANDLWTPQILMPMEEVAPELAVAKPTFNTYALGFVIRDYRGHPLVMHAGLVEGGISLSVLIPEKRVGFIVMINNEENEALNAIAFRLVDHYLGLEARDWLTLLERVHQRRTDAVLSELAKQRQAHSAPATSGPPLPLRSYAGTYRDPWYGDVTIAFENGALRITFEHTPAMRGALEHVARETFRTRFDDPRMEDAFLTFSLRSDGSIEQLKMQPVSPSADFSFDYGDLLFVPVGPVQ